MAGRRAKRRPSSSSGRPSSSDARQPQRMRAGVALFATVIGALVGVVTLIKAWPSGWWPRSTPFTLDVKVSRIEDGVNWVVSASVDDITGAPVTDDCASRARTEWARSHDGTPRELRVAVLLTSNRDDPVVISRVTVDADRTPTAPTPRTNVQLCTPGGDIVTQRTVFVDLDDDPPSIDFAGPEDSNDYTPSQYSILLNKGEAEEIVIVARADDYDVTYRWTASMRIEINGTTTWYRIDNGGVPFETTGCASGSTWTFAGPASGNDVVLCKAS